MKHLYEGLINIHKNNKKHIKTFKDLTPGDFMWVANYNTDFKFIKVKITHIKKYIMNIDKSFIYTNNKQNINIVDLNIGIIYEDIDGGKYSFKINNDSYWTIKYDGYSCYSTIDPSGIIDDIIKIHDYKI